MTAGDGARMEALARAAMDRGQAALLANDAAEARRWLDRAHRLAPTDPNVMLMLASACLTADPVAADAAMAADLFRRVAQDHDVWQAWLGLAGASLRLGQHAAARRAMQAALSGHVCVHELMPLAQMVARGTAGWCGLRADGGLEIVADRPVRLLLDDVLLPGRTLPRDWQRHRRLSVMAGRTHLLGSPIRLDRIARLAGCVQVTAEGLAGWAWHPADPDRDPVLTLRWRRSRRKRVLTLTEAGAVPHTGPLARPRMLRLPWHELPRREGALMLTGPDGKPLLGSPLDVWAETDGLAAAALQIGRDRPAAPGALPEAVPVSCAAGALPADAPMPPVPVGAGRPARSVAVVIPVHDSGDVVRACLDSVLPDLPPEARVIVVDDGSSDSELVGWLGTLAESGRIRLLRHAQALGFPGAANAGIRAARGQDVVLLNSDTLVPSGWLRRLRAAAHAAPDIGTVTPFSNDASILSYPLEAGRNPCPNLAEVRRLDRLAHRVAGATVVDIPVGVGFCLYIRRDCLDATGLLRADVFAQGYGEENDFCLRARRLGWRSVALPGLFVGHVGGSTFGASAAHLRLRNGALLERLHPGHDALIRDFIGRDPLAGTRRALDLARWKRAGKAYGGSVILISHADGGGVEQRLIQSAEAHRAAGRRPVVIRPAGSSVSVHDGTKDDFASLVYALPAEMPQLVALLHGGCPSAIEVHHVLNHPPAIYDLITNLGLPYDVHVHDYLMVCPRVSLVSRDRYCGEPEPHDCEACVADNGHFLTKETPVAALRARSAAFLAGARSVIVPSEDTAKRTKRYFPNLPVAVAPHEDDRLLPPAIAVPPVEARVCGCFVGAIGIHKGYEIVLACARDAAHRDLGLEFVICGNTTGDDRLLATGRVFVTGRYEPDECVSLIRRQRAHLGFVASVSPETWCLTLGDMWRAGLWVASFDIGAPAERIRSTGRGFLLPLGLPPGAINNSLIAAARKAVAGSAEPSKLLREAATHRA